MFFNIKYILKSYFYFLRYPLGDKYEDKGVSATPYIFVYVLIWILSMMLFLFGSWLLAVFDLELIRQPRNPIDVSLSRTIIVGMLFAPIVEELTYRYSLGKYSKNRLIIALIASYLGTTFFMQEINFSLNRTIIWACVILFFLLIRNNVKIQSFIGRYWNKYLIVLIYLSSAYFAMCHFIHPIVGTNWIFMSVAVFPHFVGALYYSFLRIKKGFLWCVLFHLAHNTLLWLPALLVSSLL